MRKIRIKARQSYAELFLSGSNAHRWKDDDRLSLFSEPIEIPWYPSRNRRVKALNKEISSISNEKGSSFPAHANHNHPSPILEASSLASSTSMQVGESKVPKLGKRTLSCPSDESSSSTMCDENETPESESSSTENFTEKWNSQVYNWRQNKYWRHLERHYQQKYPQFWIVALVLFCMVIILSVGSSQPVQNGSKNQITNSRGPSYPPGKLNVQRKCTTFWKNRFTDSPDLLLIQFDLQ
jgi:hypothetical protein